MVTQPDRPAGRGHAATAPPVKVAALHAGLTRPAAGERQRPGVRGSADAPWRPDVFVVAAYGQILRQRLLDLPPRGSLNVHASLLPRWRGASPIAAAILAGDDVTGVTLMEVVRALDAGPMVARVEEPIRPTTRPARWSHASPAAGAALLCDNARPLAAESCTAAAAGRVAGDLRAAAQARRRPARLVAARGRPLAARARLQPLAGGLHAAGTARSCASSKPGPSDVRQRRGAGHASCLRAAACRSRRR